MVVVAVAVVAFKLIVGADELVLLPKLIIGFCGVNFRPTNGDAVFVAILVELIVGDAFIEAEVLVATSEGANLKSLSIEVVVEAAGIDKIGVELLNDTPTVDVRIVLFVVLSDADAGGTNALVDVITDLSEFFIAKLAAVFVVIVVAVEAIDVFTFLTDKSFSVGVLLSFVGLAKVLFDNLSTSSKPSSP